MILLNLLVFIICIGHVFVGAMQGGEYNSVKSVPYMIQLYFTYPNRMISYCGAAILSEHWVLSAGHCIKKQGNIKTQVRVGTSLTAANGKLVNVTKIIVASEYNVLNYASDIVLLKTQDPIKFKEYQQPIRISNVSPKPGDVVTLSGYGDGHYGIEGQTLRTARVRVVDKKVCSTLVQTTEKTFCTNTTKTDLCFGDSGSPVAMNGKVVGVVSQGCEYTVPDVIVDVARFYD